MDFVALPKIELHAHLTGSVSRRTLHEIWLRKKASGETDLEDPLEVMPEDKHDYNLETFFPLFSSYIYALLTDEASIRYATTSVLDDFLADGVVYLELRTTPRATGALSAEAYVRVLLETMADFEAAHGDAMRARLILSVDRRHSPETAVAIAGMVKGGFEGHHFGHWLGVDGPRISLATDDVGVFGSSLSNEYRLVAQHFDLDRSRICDLARQAIDSIFGGEEEKVRLREIMWT
ncbi:hypothetical protein HIM_04330 [Hirsutella minnesotensis 3608]|uniref:Adenosine deaminase domain-containing protein n=1 Tax=Hirsutella minnesotensis 3608 TaxID=1043627 RepID=A0A0F7ZVA0_9HYPO|nr:hypothetical protein HIM_04330 [Hirsutella minnesotensis 3608]